MSELLDERAVRIQKRQDLLSDGVAVYPSATNRTHEIKSALNNFDNLVAADKQITIAGRVLAVRSHGGSVFMPINDGTETLQLFIKKDVIGEESFSFVTDIDHGDFVAASGKLFITKRGEKSLLVDSPLVLLAKALRPLPEKWHGLTDPELRVRKRYLDFLSNEESKKKVIIRSQIFTAVRDFFNGREYLEVETPILQTIPGGATARPFKTHLNALNLDLYLRVAPELYLKRLVVSGMPKVFEMARCFRNEGMDHSHNPEFTQIEAYEAYANYHDYMLMIEELLRTLVLKIHGQTNFLYGEHTIDVGQKFAVVDWVEQLNQKLGVNIETVTDEELRKTIKVAGVKIEDHEGRGSMLDAAYKILVRPYVIQPTFFTHLPVEMSPLAKPSAHYPTRAERFSLVLGGGIELVNGYSELNDPVLQLQKFEEQEALRAAGDDEAHRIDDDYIEALEHGMPPTAGFGMGIDRLSALLTNSSTIKDIILFPTVKPKNVIE